MIKFLNLKNQICDGSNNFAFYDTVSNTICSFGEQCQQVFGSLEGFKYEFGKETESTTRPLSRFLDLIPDGYFEKRCLHHKAITINEGKEHYCPDCGKIG